ELKHDIFNQVEKLDRTIEVMERDEDIRARTTKREEAITTPIAASKTRREIIEMTNDRISKDRFNSLGEQLAAVIQAGIRGHVDPRLYMAATGLGESVPSEGGFLIQQDFSAELLQDVFETGILSQRCRSIEISSPSNSMKLNGVDETSRASTLWGGIQVYMVDEGTATTPTKPKFRKIELNLHKMMGVCYLTDELMQDMAALEGWVRQGFTSAFGFKVDDQIFQGTGAGEALGIMNGGSLVTVDKEAGQPAATIMAENVEKMWSRMFGQSLKSAEWFINQNCYPQLFQMSHAVGTGGIPVFMPPGGLSVAPYGNLLGRPVTPIEQCATLGTTGDIVFADFANGYILARKGGIRQDVSIHVAFLTDQQVLRFILRIDGQPVRATTLTPYKGTSASSQSHFIALATRS
ncbi:MAG TPA: phage major capsid protein, partial [Hyphomicrobiaceae bacterium]|nr:phage major capsid protein [Hyphomicrobiaceae bacterium]